MIAFARPIELDACESTNDEVDRLAAGGAPEGTVVTAELQRSGRGRRGRTWHSPPGANLYMSILLRPALSPRDVPPITLAAGLAVCEAVNGFGARASLKWPNDVVIAGRKLAGVLTEMTTHATALSHVTVGIGINVNQTEFAPEIAAIATSLRAVTGGAVDREALRDAVLERVGERVAQFYRGGVAAIAREWWASCANAGDVVRAGEVVGRAVGLDTDGALVVVGEGGERHVIRAGEITAA